jgi:hypothetical protein
MSALEPYNYKSDKSAVWKRGAFMLVFMFAFSIGQSLLFLTAVVQFFWLLIKSEPNAALTSFGHSLAQWLAGVANFLTCVSEEKPFPWSGWPRAI